MVLADFDPDQLATPYHRHPGTDALVPLEQYTRYEWPAAALRSSAHDLARFLRLYAGAGTVDGQVVLASDTITRLLTVPDESPAGHQALAWGAVHLDPETWTWWASALRYRR